MDRFVDATIATGSWQVWSPTNVFGFDEQDPPKLTAFIDMVIPFKPFSSVLGEQLSWWARANLPMNAGCAALPGACPDLGALLNSMFKVPMSRMTIRTSMSTIRRTSRPVKSPPRRLPQTPQASSAVTRILRSRIR